MSMSMVMFVNGHWVSGATGSMRKFWKVKFCGIALEFYFLTRFCGIGLDFYLLTRFCPFWTRFRQLGPNFVMLD